MTLRRWPKVEELREKLNGKAKAEKTFRFYLLWPAIRQGRERVSWEVAECEEHGALPGEDPSLDGQRPDLEAG